MSLKYIIWTGHVRCYRPTNRDCGDHCNFSYFNFHLSLSLSSRSLSLLSLPLGLVRFHFRPHRPRFHPCTEMYSFCSSLSLPALFLHHSTANTKKNLYSILSPYHSFPFFFVACNLRLFRFLIVSKQNNNKIKRKEKRILPDKKYARTQWPKRLDEQFMCMLGSRYYYVLWFLLKANSVRKNKHKNTPIEKNERNIEEGSPYTERETGLNFWCIFSSVIMFQSQWSTVTVCSRSIKRESFFCSLNGDKESESIAMTSMMMTMMTSRRNFRLWILLKNVWNQK